MIEDKEFIREQIRKIERIWHNAFVWPKVFSPTEDLLELDKKFRRLEKLLENN